MKNLNRQERNEWIQKFLDGELTPDERQSFEMSLENDSELKSEFLSFQEFKHAMAQTRFHEDMPTRRLEELLPKTKTATIRLPWLRLALGSLLICLMAAGYLGFTYDPLRPNHANTLAILQSPSPAAAAIWVENHANIHVPPINECPLATLTKAKIGSGWVSYDYVYRDQTYTFYVTSDVKRVTCHAATCRMNNLAVVEGKGLAWTHCGAAFYLEGGSADGRKQLASNMCKCICYDSPAGKHTR